MVTPIVTKVIVHYLVLHYFILHCLVLHYLVLYLILHCLVLYQGALAQRWEEGVEGLGDVVTGSSLFITHRRCAYCFVLPRINDSCSCGRSRIKSRP